MIADLSKKINRICRYFEDNNNGYTFVVLDNYNALLLLNEEIVKQTSKNIGVFNFDVDSDVLLFKQLANFSSNFDAIIINNLIEVESFDNDTNNFLYHLNFARESLLALNKPLLFWCSPELMQVLSNKTADLYSQRNQMTLYIENFNWPLTYDPDREEIPESFFEKLTPPASDDDIKLKEQQFEKAKTLNISQKELFENYILPLYEAYSSRDDIDNE